VKRLILDCDRTTLMTVVCTPPPPPSYFRRGYHMWRTLFLSIMHNLSETSPYFSERYDATDRIDLTTL
jgi:hypothetical protein